MSKLIVNEIEKYDAGQLTITTGTNVSIGSNLTVSGSIAGTLSTAAQTNITSVGTLSSLAVSGNLQVDNDTLFVNAAANKVGVKISSINAAVDFQVEGVIASSGGGSKILVDTVENWGNNLTLNSAGGFPTIFQTNGSERMRLNATGLGIGTSSPQQKIHVASIADNSYGLITTAQNWANNMFTGIKIGSTGDTYAGGVDIRSYSYYAANAGTSMAFWVNSPSNVFTEAMRIASSGNVGIGTSSPSEFLQVAKNQNATTRFLVSNSDSTNTNSRASIRTESNGVIGEMVSINDLSVFLGAASNHGLGLMTNGGQRIFITSGGDVEITSGNLSFANGKGIDFSASAGGGATSSLLDDYEEGTFTPFWLGGGANPSVAYNFQIGSYTKIGNLVYVTIRLGNTSTSGGSANLYIGGLPFVVNSNPFYPAATVGYKADFVTNGPDYGRFSSGATHIELFLDNNTSETPLFTTNLGSITQLIISGCYQV